MKVTEFTVNAQAAEAVQGFLQRSRAVLDQPRPAIRILRRVPLGLGARFTLIALGAVGLSEVLQNHMAHHLVDKLLERQRNRIRDRVTAFDGTLHNAEASVRRYADLISHRTADLASESGSFIAEGVETEDQRHVLLQQSWNEVQGCLTGRPMPPEAIAGFLGSDGRGSSRPSAPF